MDNALNTISLCRHVSTDKIKKKNRKIEKRQQSATTEIAEIWEVVNRRYLDTRYRRLTTSHISAISVVADCWRFSIFLFFFLISCFGVGARKIEKRQQSATTEIAEIWEVVNRRYLDRSSSSVLFLRRRGYRGWQGLAFRGWVWVDSWPWWASSHLMALCVSAKDPGLVEFPADEEPVFVIE
jgi:hypothetical protein